MARARSNRIILSIFIPAEAQVIHSGARVRPVRLRISSHFMAVAACSNPKCKPRITGDSAMVIARLTDRRIIRLTLAVRYALKVMSAGIMIRRQLIIRGGSLRDRWWWRREEWGRSRVTVGPLRALRPYHASLHGRLT